MNEQDSNTTDTSQPPIEERFFLLERKFASAYKARFFANIHSSNASDGNDWYTQSKWRPEKDFQSHLLYHRKIIF